MDMQACFLDQVCSLPERGGDVWVPLAVALEIEFTDLAIEIAGLKPHFRVLTPTRFCPCDLESENNRAACLRSPWTFQLPRQPRARARQRQRRGGRSCERGPPGDDDGGDGDGPRPQRLITVARCDRDREPFAGRRS